MGMSGLSKYSRLMVRLYVAVLMLGVTVGLSTDIELELDSGSAIYEIAWPLAGVMFGMAWSGIGPAIALFAVGIYAAGLIKAYAAAGGTLFVGEGTVSSQLVTSTIDMARGSMEVLAFLYGAVGGMYLAIYYAEIFDYGTSVDDTAKKNFLRKLAQSLAIASVAVGLRVVAV
ncbi:MAG: hypothetical protein V3R93_04640 [Candidatus Hydrothermarchaeaceae archaeon]